jgi:hypothetical protein
MSTTTETLAMLEDLYAIANDPSRTPSQARVDARLRIRTYKTKLRAGERDDDRPTTEA